MTDGLKARTLHALVWSFIERMGQQGIQFVISIILARLLMPAEFGLIGMLTVFMAVAQAFVDSGFGQSLIQKQNATRVDESSAFYFNIVVGVVAAAILCLIAPWIAAFYSKPVLVPITRVFSINLIIGSFGVIQTVLMTKRVDFKAQMKVSLTATALSGVVGVVLAALGCGVWSLVAQSMAYSLCRTALLWVVHPWRPVRQFSLAALREMFGFGSRLLFAGLLDTVFRNIYLMVIGRVYSAADLGYYTRAKGFQRLPSENITSTVSRVTFPVFSSIQHDKPRLKRGVRRAISTVAMFNFPMMCGMVSVAAPCVNVLVTDKWAPCVPYLQLLCILGMLYPLHAINLNVLTAQGRSDLFFRLEVLKKSITLLAIFCTYQWGVSVMIMGGIASSCVALVLNSYYTAVFVKYPLYEQIVDVLPYLGMAVATAAVAWCVGCAPFPSDLVQLTAQVLTGAATYVLLGSVFRPSAFVEVSQLARSQLARYFRTRALNA